MGSAEAPTGVNEGEGKSAPLAKQTWPPLVRVTARRWTKWYLDGTESFWPFTDLIVRFFIAMWFLRSGLVKAADWDTALYLAANEYPVSWMEPGMAATIGLTIELVGPILLIAGAFTRPAALAMAVLTAVSQAVYVPTTSNLLVIAMLAWYVAAGAAALSVDRAIGLALKDGERPIVRRLVTLLHWSRAHLAPALMAFIRLWLGVTLLVHADWIDPPIGVQTWLPTSIFYGIPDWIAIISALFFVTGFGAVVVSYGLFFLIGYFMIAEAHPNVTLFPFLFLSLYEARGAGMVSLDRAILTWLEENLLMSADQEPAKPSWIETWAVRVRMGWVMRLLQAD